MLKIIPSSIYLLLLSLTFPLNAAIVIKNGTVWNADNVATLSPEEHYHLAVEAFEKQDYVESAKQFNIVALNFPSSPLCEDAHFFLAVSHYHLNEFDIANDGFNVYLKLKNHPKYFQETIEYKFLIAEAFKKGARRHMWGYKQLPKLMKDPDLAHDIYNEVIASLPCHEMAANSFYSKAEIHRSFRDYKEAVDCYQTIIKRFPKHELAPISFLAIIEIYLEQSKREFQNPDLLALAELNLRKFKKAFPSEPRVEIAERDVHTIKEVYAQGLFDTGQFYERINQPKASFIYYQNAIKKFPDTHVAEQCKTRLERLQHLSITEG